MPLAQIEDHTFFTQFLGPDAIVLDFGANRGAFSRAVIAQFGARCYAVEANPQLAAAIEPDPKLTVLSMAVGPRSGTFPLYICPHDEMSTLVPTPDAVSSEVIQVRVARVPELVEELKLPRVDLLKLDVEGAEVEILEACPEEFLRMVPQITVEFHDFNGMITREAAERAIGRLRQLGFDVVRMWMRSYGDTLFVNRRLARVGRLDWAWSRLVRRNWWWFRRFVGRKVGLAR